MYRQRSLQRRISSTEGEGGQSPQVLSVGVGP
jgi:hypothetical protein